MIAPNKDVQVLEWKVYITVHKFLYVKHMLIIFQILF